MALYGWALMTALCIVLTETLYIALGAWITYWWLFVPLAIVNSLLIYRLTLAAPSLPDAFLVFGVSTATLRLGSSTVLLHQTIAPGTLVGWALLVTANIIRVWWR